MKPADYGLGFWVLDGKTGSRRLIDWAVAFQAYADCDERAETQREAYLSAFTFGPNFRDYLSANGSTTGYDGSCWSSWLWWDIDREGDLTAATIDARRLVVAIGERLGVDDDDMLVFYSGSKGFHVGVPTILWRPEPSRIFNKACRRFAERTIEAAGVTIDTGIYAKVQLFRAPNSQHPKTSNYKRRLAVDELMELASAVLKGMAVEPEPFEIPTPTYASERAAELWADAVEQVQRETEAVRNRRASAVESATLNRATLEVLADRLCFVRPPFDLANVAATADVFRADMIVLDYILRIRPPGDHDNRRGSVDATMDYLRQFADAGVAVVVVAAVARTKDKRGRSSYSGDGLNLASFRESSELEFGADSAYILVPGVEDDDPVTLRHLKARHTDVADIELDFDRPHQRFTPSIGTGRNASAAERGKLRASLAALWNRTTPASDDEGGGVE